VYPYVGNEKPPTGCKGACAKKPTVGRSFVSSGGKLPVAVITVLKEKVLMLIALLLTARVKLAVTLSPGAMILPEMFQFSEKYPSADAGDQFRVLKERVTFTLDSLIKQKVLLMVCPGISVPQSMSVTNCPECKSGRILMLTLIIACAGFNR
jgi:hypothetical protein